MSTIASGLQDSVRQLQAVTDVPELEAELLLAHVLACSRAWLHTFSDRELSVTDSHTFLALVERRLQREPIAYIIGHQAFWSYDFLVTSDTLIPRPETETVIEWMLKQYPDVIDSQRVIADLGTGSGAIALTLAKERPDWCIHATDISEQALQVAAQNLTRLEIKNVTLWQGSWCHPLPQTLFDAIISNPPYIADGDIHLDALRFEPKVALVAKENGLAAIRAIAEQAKVRLKSGGCLILEHGYQQALDVCSILRNNGYTDVDVHRDLFGVERVTTAKIVI